MKAITNGVATIRSLLRQLGNELGQLNHRIGGRSGLKDLDLAGLDVLARNGPQTPSALAKALQVHPATMTGMLDRLEAGGWIARERSPVDRRLVHIGLVPDRGRDLLGLYAGMNGEIGRIAGSYDAAQLAVIIDFLSRIVDAGRAENRKLEGDGKSGSPPGT
jgi:DNA-binding MarR family transcriptional regulator